MFAAVSVPAQACSVLSPSSAFISANDKNGDGALSKKEWRRAKLPEGLKSSRKIGTATAFARLDVNKNGKLEYDELEFVDYIKNPCEDWERQIRSQENKQ